MASPAESPRLADRRASRHPALAPFDEKLRDCRRKSKIDLRDFILASRLIEWLLSPANLDEADAGNNASKILDAVYPRTHEFDPRMRERLLSPPDEQEELTWLLIIIILLQMGRYISRFPFIINIFYQHGQCDAVIPIDKQATDMRSCLARIGFDDSEIEDFILKFRQLQWQLISDKAFDDVHKNGYSHSPGELILPITDYKPMSEGGLGQIYGIEVPYECIPPKLKKRIKRDPYQRESDTFHQFALKVLRNRDSYEEETRAYRALEQTDGIVQCFGHWSCIRDGTKEYHLLLEWGTYDLDDYFHIYPPPTTTSQVRKFWKGLADLPYALSKIHTMTTKDGLEDGPGAIYYGWHGDIKPSNIVFCEETNRGWKICDPGFAKFVMKNNAKCLSDGPRLPVIKLMGGTRTYGGPERDDRSKTPNISPRFDIWSLGCVFSEAATWVILGHRGVERYKLVRKSCEIKDDPGIDGGASDRSDEEDVDPQDSLGKCRGSDRFYDAQTKEVSNAVLDWHELLRHSIRSNDFVTAQMLHMIERHMLQRDASQRFSAEQIRAEMDTLLKEAQKKEVSDPALNYRMPRYFTYAIKEEQEKEAKNFKYILRSSNSKYKSKYIDNPAFDEATRLPAADFDDHMQEITPHGSLSHFESQRTGSYIQSTGGIERADLDNKQIPRINYYDARKLLEEDGWVPGTLELRKESHSVVPENPVSPTVARPESAQSVRELTISSRQGTGSSGYKRRSLGRALLFRVFNKSETDHASPRSEVVSRDPESPARPGTISRSHQPLALQTKETAAQKILANHYDGRDIVFVVDDAPSMRHHWLWTRDLLAVLVAFLYGRDENGMDLFFTSSKTKYGPFHEPKEFFDVMTRMTPAKKEESAIHEEMSSSGDLSLDPPSFPGPSSLGSHYSDAGMSASANTDDDGNDICDTLTHILEQWNPKDRKLTVIILTDGVWSSVNNRETVSRTLRLYLERKADKKRPKRKLMDRALSIQFIQLGDDIRAERELKQLDNGIEGDHGEKLPDIIDHEKANGNIYKMLIGSLNPNVDLDEELTTVTGEAPPDASLLEYAQSPGPISSEDASPGSINIMTAGSGSRFNELSWQG